jgi:hypothetical protein
VGTPNEGQVAVPVAKNLATNDLSLRAIGEDHALGLSSGDAAESHAQATTTNDFDTGQSVVMNLGRFQFAPTSIRYVDSSLGAWADSAGTQVAIRPLLHNDRHGLA